MRKLSGLFVALAMTATLLTGGLAPAQAAPAQAAPAAPAAPAVSDPFLAKILEQANAYRAANGAGPLVINTAMSTGSQQWAATLNDRVNKGIDIMPNPHRSDYGKSILPKGYDWFSEIIGINNTAQQVVDWWMGSPGHRAALMDKQATDIGIGYVKTTKAGWSGMTIAVANLAGYPESRKNQPQPPAPPVARAGDVAAIDPAGNLFIYASAQGGDLWQRTFVSAGWSGVQQLDLADYNADGITDVLAMWKNGDLTVSYGQANGTLKAAQVIGRGWTGMDIVVSKWRTADKFPSVIAKYRGTGELFLYPNTNGTNFGAKVRIGTGWGSLKISAVDFDGDQRQDIVARNAAGQLLLYRGTGTGGFVSESRRVVGTGWGSFTHIQGITNHLGTNAEGLLARTANGDLRHYPIAKNTFGPAAVIGRGGWGPLILGS
ncbi:hypothetical protein AL755_04460 [Arthrobacter sp. ERGS1:01]|uniref:CAP domain-containing protein n=1 Tax=Arthrobacter sp. ERGS1:01 TaxID=1704044 RepID=UPI0006B6736A|nr:CAP domain-containing protein [Arthrobacter sp. ERGS1:01]ALE04918.1 hypothetical protein AL755_04460 [Arthrobacter sp. ERGS1:01]